MKLIYQISLGIIIIILVIYLISTSVVYLENFQNRKEDKYDELDAKLYDEVYDFSKLYKADAESIRNFLKTRLSVDDLEKKEVKILDAGAGCGKHYQYLSKWFHVSGIDKSINLLDIARARNPLGEFKRGKLEDEEEYEKESQDGITCLVETIHLNNDVDMKKVIQNFHRWLKPKGYLFMHLFDPKNLDPGPREFSQYYQEGDIKHALTYFEDFSLDTWWQQKSKGDNYQYVQKFILENGKSRVKIIDMYIPSLKTMIQKILDQGFKLIAVKDLEKEHIEAFRMYVFQKI